ncbi:hypothetical protein V5799_008383 [Amblyomma americanum]|uniref:Uncharacterized protein n=1 Tax=Amblyomma americanum TaxID=6943 RepID=A0AAQ4FF11_AMBAM
MLSTSPCLAFTVVFAGIRKEEAILNSTIKQSTHLNKRGKRTFVLLLVPESPVLPWSCPSTLIQACRPKKIRKGTAACFPLESSGTLRTARCRGERAARGGA